MKLPISWLRDHLAEPPELDTLTRALTDLGLEVEAVHRPDPALASLKAARVLDVEQHPNAERLKVCRVACDGEHPVVCGAPNVAAGIVAAFAPLGARIPASEIPISPREIRGVTSAGMLCSEKEIGLGKDGDGILILPPDTAPGTGVIEALGLDEPVIDIALTPNRGDCAGVRGIARDLAAAGHSRLKPLPRLPRISLPSRRECPLTLEAADEVNDACPFFAGRVIAGVRNRPSPPWLARRLRACGLTPISALVDITQYFTLDRCRPLHVFDRNRIGERLILRPARAGETFLALDRRRYDLEAGVTVIADENGILALGGLIGGLASGVRDDTTDVFLESAWFDPARTARSGRTLGIESDARYRFERGVDPHSVLPALDAASRMIIDLCGGQASRAVIHGQAPAAPAPVSLRPDRLRTFGGSDIRPARARKILRDLGFRPEKSQRWHVPSWRTDIDTEQDLIEEVMRVHGYDSIRAEPMPGPPRSPTREERKPGAIAHCLASQGLFETIGWSFLDPGDAALFASRPPLRITNPISAAMAVLRPSLIPSLTRAGLRNRRHGRRHARLFEIGPVWNTGGADQTNRVGWLRSGIIEPRRWNRTQRRVEILDIEADLHSLSEVLEIDPVDWHIVAADDTAGLDPARRASVLRPGPRGESIPVGVIGALSAASVKRFDSSEDVFIAELDIDALPPLRSDRREPPTLSPFLPIERDFAFTLDVATPIGDLIRAIRAVDPKHIRTVDLFDLYRGEKISSGTKSAAITIRIESFEATLREEEIRRICEGVVQAAAALGAQLRAKAPGVRKRPKAPGVRKHPKTPGVRKHPKTPGVRKHPKK